MIAAAPAGTWVLDPDHTTLGFSARHAGVANVRGHFSDFEGTIRLQPDGSLAGTAIIRVASVETGLEPRDDHLRSPDFFDAERHPEMTFVTTEVDVEDPDDVMVVGDLTIRGVTRQIALRGEIVGIGEDDAGQTRLGLSLTGELSRAEFGMRFNYALGGGNVLVGDRVRLAVEISAILQD